MNYQKKLFFLVLLLSLLLTIILISCGTVDTKTDPNASSDVVSDAVSNPTTNAENIQLNVVGIDNNRMDEASFHHLISRANIQGTSSVFGNVQALETSPQKIGSVSFNPQLATQFTGSPRVDMKLLIISAEGAGKDPTLDGITFFAKEIGVPYDVLIAKDQNLTERQLVKSNGDGRYQGIITTEVGLLYNRGGTFVSGFNNTEWNLLWEYARKFNVRQIAMSGFPGTFPEDYGLRNITQSGDELTARLTTQGRTVFSSLKSNVRIPIKGAFTYEASLCGSACSQITTTPILQNRATGNVLAAVTTTADDREILSLTMNHNSFLRHTGLLTYDLISWVTEGIFIGERRMYYSVDIDDHYLESAVWNPATNSDFPEEGPGSRTYRITATDLYNARDGVLDLRSRFNSPDFNYNQVFNAFKADPDATRNCANNATLSEATLCVGDFFPWISHTFTHAEMDFLNTRLSRREFLANIRFAEARLPNFDRKYLVTGKHSGLGWYRIANAGGRPCVVDQVAGDPFCQFGLRASNTDMLDAAEALGIQYLAANRGWDTHVAPCDTCLITHPLNSNIKLVPRWPTNIFFNTTTPRENTSEFNYLYGPDGIVKDANGNPFFSRNQTWSQILAFETDITMRHILSTSPYPHFVHQNNLREYRDGRNLIYDLSEAVLREYSNYFSLPLISQDWNELTDTLEKRTSFYNSRTTGIINKLNNAVQITSANGGTVYVTGLRLPRAQSFNYGKVVSEIQLDRGGRVSQGNLSFSGSTPPPSSNEAPSLRFVNPSPANNASVNAGVQIQVKVNASDSDGSIRDVKLYVNDVLARTDRTEPYQWLSHRTLRNLSAGSYTIRVVATDNQGEATTKSRTFTVR